jgi:hypothetical protein
MGNGRFHLGFCQLKGTGAVANSDALKEFSRFLSV